MRVMLVFVNLPTGLKKCIAFHALAAAHSCIETSCKKSPGKLEPKLLLLAQQATVRVQQHDDHFLVQS